MTYVLHIMYPIRVTLECKFPTTTAKSLQTSLMRSHNHMISKQVVFVSTEENTTEVQKFKRNHLSGDVRL